VSNSPFSLSLLTTRLDSLLGNVKISLPPRPPPHMYASQGKGGGKLIEENKFQTGKVKFLKLNSSLKKPWGLD